MPTSRSAAIAIASPPSWPGHLVTVRLSLEGQLSVYDGEQLVAQHVLQPADRGWVTVPGHHAALWARTLDVERRPAGGVRGGGHMELTSLLERMKMEHLLAQLDGVCEQAAKGDVDYKGFLTQALEAEWRGRHQRGVESRLKLARFPWLKTLDQFDFDFQPSVDRKMLRELAGLSFVERTENVVLLGPPESAT